MRYIGISALRKRGIFAPLKELIFPYQPSDYRAIVAGEWERQEPRRVTETSA